MELEKALEKPLCFFSSQDKYDTTAGDLPHRTRNGLVQYVTFRSADSLPQSKIKDLKDIRNQFIVNHPAPLTEDDKLEYHNKIGPIESRFLDNGYGKCILQNPDARLIVRNSIMHFDGQRYDVLAFVIMPNHIHLLLVAYVGFSLSSILHSIKSYTSNKINLLYCRKGRFWQRECFDRFVRSDKDYNRIVDYIKSNPQHLSKGQYTLYINPIYEDYSQELVKLAMLGGAEASSLRATSAKI